eukprot:UN32556
MWIEVEKNTTKWIKFRKRPLPFEIATDKILGRTAIVTKISDPLHLERGFFPWSQLLNVNNKSLVNIPFAEIQNIIAKEETPLLFEFEPKPRTDYLDVRERNKDERFCMGQFLHNQLPFKNKLWKISINI